MKPGLMMLSAAAAILSSSSEAPARAGEQYFFQCDVALQLQHGRLTASRSLYETDRTPMSSDTAQWNPEPYQGWSISWMAAPSHIAPKRLDAVAGKVQLFVRTEKKLPRLGLLTLVSGDNPYDQLVLPISTGADPRLSSTTLPLRALLAFAGDRAALGWTILDGRERNGTRVQHASGEVALAPLREANDAIAKAGTMLDAMAAQAPERCKRYPIEIDPYAEI